MTLDDDRNKVIENTKFLIGELNRIQALYYDTLIDELGVKEGEEDWIFDYLYNNTNEGSFEEFLQKYGLELDDVINE